MGALEFYMRDVYPDSGMVETSTVVQPDEEDLITAEDDQKTAEKATNATAAGSNRNQMFLAVALLVIIAVIIGIVS